MLSYVNLTRHPINLIVSGEEQVIPPSGEEARVSQLPATPINLQGISMPVFPPATYGPVTGLPAPAKGYAFIVSGLVAREVEGRADVFCPATGPSDGALRNERGHIKGVTRLRASGK